MTKKEELYKRIKIAGLISYIPIMMVTAPLGGYFLGDYLQKEFRLPYYVMLVCVGMGLVVGIREAVRIIRKVLAIDKGGVEGA
ncbi:MAG: AtpZ/AtpI family protein [Candidatus Omnitrophica bacterium]|nr:AtpZ/AtpI family protein [Candidatus Omnitrophota bacterium]